MHTQYLSLCNVVTQQFSNHSWTFYHMRTFFHFRVWLFSLLWMAENDTINEGSLRIHMDLVITVGCSLHSGCMCSHADHWLSWSLIIYKCVYLAEAFSSWALSALWNFSVFGNISSLSSAFFLSVKSTTQLAFPRLSVSQLSWLFGFGCFLFTTIELSHLFHTILILLCY